MVYISQVYNGAGEEYIRTNEIIFKIPVSASEEDKAEILAEQVEAWLTRVSNCFVNYEIAITIVQVWLKQFIRTDPSRRPWVEKGAEIGGRKFVEKVDAAKKKAGQVISVNLRSLFRKV